MSKLTLEDRFWSKVDKSGDCWIWAAGTNKKGYGTFYNKLRTKKTNAHQVSWILHNGDIPEGMCVCHTCDNTSCVNPSHLWLGTSKDNSDDMDRKGRRVNTILWGEEHPQHGTNSKFAKLDEEKVRKIRDLRKTTNLTLREVAEMFGVSHGLINNILQGRKWSWLK